MPYFRQDPLVEGRLDGWNRGSADRLALPRLRLFEPNLRLFFERDTDLLFDNAVEVLRGVYLGVGDDLPRPPFPLAAIQGTGTRDWADALTRERSFLLTL